MGLQSRRTEKDTDFQAPSPSDYKLRRREGKGEVIKEEEVSQERQKRGAFNLVSCC